MNKGENKLIKSFSLGAIKWSVKEDNIRMSNEECLGVSEQVLCSISIATEYKGIGRNKTSIEQTLYHEVVHAILDTLGESELSSNEKFVQSFSLLLHQFETTKN